MNQTHDTLNTIQLCQPQYHHHCPADKLTADDLIDECMNKLEYITTIQTPFQCSSERAH